MVVAPAVDLRGGRCVQLVGGRPEEERISLPDPVAQAMAWWEMGFRTLHLVDLDAALTLGDNRAVIRRIAGASPATLQVGGGVRDEEGVRRLMDDGAARAIVGTRAVEDPEWLQGTAQEFPDRIMVAADIREGVVLKRGWTESSGVPVLDFVRELDRLPLAGVLCTDVGREGQMAGIDLTMAAAVVAGSRHPIWISGGISSMDELRALASAGATGAVLGMAIYTGTLPPEEVAQEFGS